MSLVTKLQIEYVLGDVLAFCTLSELVSTFEIWYYKIFFKPFSSMILGQNY